MGVKKKTVVGLARAIKDKELDPRSLKIADRRALVEYLTDEGYTIPQIADFVDVNEKTVDNDRRLIRKNYAVHAIIDDPDTYVGKIIRDVELRKSRLRQTVKGKKDALSEEEEAALLGALKGIGFGAKQAAHLISNLRVGVIELINLELLCHRVDMDLFDRLIKIGKIPAAALKLAGTVRHDHSVKVSITEEEARQRITEITGRLRGAGALSGLN